MFSLCHFLFSWVCFCLFFLPRKRSQAGLQVMSQKWMRCTWSQVINKSSSAGTDVSFNVNIMPRKVRDKRKRKKHRDVEKAAMAFSRVVPSNVLVERTQSNGSNAINISLFFLFTSTRYMFYRSSTSLGTFFCLFRTRKVYYNFSGVFYLF